MAFDDEYQSRVITYPTFTELGDILNSYFEVLSYSMEYGMPTFTFKWPNGQIPHTSEQEHVFEELSERAERLKVWAFIRWADKKNGIYYLRFVPIQKAPESNNMINYALFIVTLATIALAGFLQATSPVFLTLFYPGGYTVWDIAFVVITFMASLMGIIFCHEMGHYLTARSRGIDSTLPYFIPGLPPLGGTFGAFIQQKSPPHNRRDLFDLGVMGPLAGFAVTLVVLFIGFFMSVPVTQSQITAIEAQYPLMTGSIEVPYLFTLIEMLFSGMIPAGGTIYLHPIAFAAWVGMLVTALNLFPISQLDGGHALRSIVDSDKHKLIGWIALGIMFVTGYFMMAILILLISRGGDHPGSLNDTIPISKSRVVLFIISMIILALCIPPLWGTLFSF